MAPERQSRPHHAQLTRAKARLCALLPRLTEREIEALLGIAELFAGRPNAESTTRVSERLVVSDSGPHVTPAPSAVPSHVVPAAPPYATTLSPSGGRPTYTVREAAHLLGMKESALRERIRMGRVRVLRLGQRVLVRSEELERLMAEASARLLKGTRR